MMMLDELRAKVREWDTQNPNNEPIADGKYGRILNQIEYHAKNEWRVYLPAEHPDFNSSYMERLAAWIGNLPSEDDQKLLLEYALQISFFSHEDFVALYRTALNREVFQWVASQPKINLNLDLNGGQGFHDEVHRQIHQHTWFCPVTDSMEINKFCKANHLVGISEHPGFSALQKMAEYHISPNLQIADDWIRYMLCPNQGSEYPLERLVLLEDIVGSGKQCLDAVRWAVKKIGKPILFIPLILCPNGAKALREEEKQLKGKLTVRPVIELNRSDLLGPESKGQNTWLMTQKMEALAKQVSTGTNAFGYKTTGCSLATFSNTPDNTLPIIHRKFTSGNWNPLFPRVDRGD